MPVKKKALVIRYGGLGDGIIASCCFPYIARDGYDITVNGSKSTLEVLKYNPYVKDTIEHDRDTVKPENLEKHWESISEGFDKVVNLTSTMENSHLFSCPQPQYYKCLRWKRFNSWRVNWYDNQVFKAGYVPDRPLGELYFSDLEKTRAKKFLWRFGRRKFYLVWGLCGSSIHKVYRYFETVARRLLDYSNDIVIITSGGYDTKLLTFEHERVANVAMLEKNFRFSAALAKYASCVVGPETGILNAAGCFKTPKVCFLTHSSKENLTKYWHNDYSIQADVYCSPCYMLHKYMGIWTNHCQVNELGLPKCIDSPAPGVLFETIRRIYDKWTRS
jgi:ADP-heptose:LPS heptosyltransferase